MVALNAELDACDFKWLREHAIAEGTSLAEQVRHAVAWYRMDMEM